MTPPPTVPSLLPVPASLKNRNPTLCSVCKKLNLTPRRFVILPGDPETRNEASVDLGLLEAIRKKAPNCPFCRLVLAALGPKTPLVGKDGAKVTVTIAWGTDGSFQRRPSIHTLMPHAETTKGGYIEETNMFPEIRMLANDAPSNAKKTQLVRIIKNRIDFSMVRNWLNICKIQHGSACDETKMMDHQIKDPAKDISHFRLIDVVDNCVIPAPHNAKYVALSYVWGKIDPTTILRSLLNNYKQLEKAGALLVPKNHDIIPITIRDAIQVVRELNLRYLWVDSLCIIQDDIGPGGSKMSSISKMDLVYGAAYLTIWAATGSDANAGLPGVRPNTRGITQPIEQVLPTLRLAFMPRSQDYVPEAVYYTRAWTLQEQEFTKRELVFIGGQVVYNCVKGTEWREDVLFEDGNIEQVKAASNDNDDIGQFEGLIQSYSGLSLTKEKDIYDAFAGLNNYFKNRLNVNLVHGIPDAYFDWFLLWHPLGVQKRRDKAPSWSWSGWIGQSWPNMWDWYNPRITKIRCALRQRTWIIWYQRKADNSEEVIQVWTPKQSSQPTSKPLNFYGGVTKNRFPIDCSRTVPTRRKLVRAVQYYPDSHNPAPGSGLLQF
ncbi:heterokaryon incompatibility protein-domain-containing protein [Gymnopilus junonius]|uniref:Heterokaryon incompatibility protein-domain-containing protein n=1 Tax=Gymnopilus junonius TaxID=109634 RepID=A0A9P5NG31_GYMJU|nr:heterokaryon incompatibility protein-domain-containing protein [Gymnopilus junonius]